MQRVAKEGLLAPNICIVCEERPDGDVVDTLRQGNFGGASPFNGRKYVCWRCVEEFAKLFNFEKGEHVEESKAAEEQAVKQVQVIKARVKDFADSLVKFADGDVVPNDAGEVVISQPVADAPKKKASEVKAVKRSVKQKEAAPEEG